MSDPIHVWVGTDQRMAAAELTLAYSLRKHASRPLVIHWMRAGDPGWTWKGQPALPYPGDKSQWATQFTCHRYAIPELMGFAGKAVYLDVDMVAFADIADLIRLPLSPKPWGCNVAGRDDVSVIDCSRFDVPWWPRLDAMRDSGWTKRRYKELLTQHDYYARVVPEAWDSLDRYQAGTTKLLHFTRMETQPWKPWKERFAYPPHPDPGAAAIWHRYHEEAKAHAAT